MDEGLIFLSYHNSDLGSAFQLATALQRYYREVFFDRFELGPGMDWEAGIIRARERATSLIAIVSDDYLESPYCRAEYEAFQARGGSAVAVFARDFFTEQLARWDFRDWVDLRRWFKDPGDAGVETLLRLFPASESAARTSERVDYLRGFMQETELAVARMPTSWLSLWVADSTDGSAFRPRLARVDWLRGWEFAAHKSGETESVADLLAWAAEERQFALCGPRGSGKTAIARLLSLAQAHAALADDEAALPLWLDLAEWDGCCSSPESFIELQWGLVSYWKHWLENHQACFVLDNWDVLRARFPDRAQALAQWIADNPQQRFVIAAADASGLPALPRVQIPVLNERRAGTFAASYLSLSQRDVFRELWRRKSALIENSGLDFLSLGLELLAVDRALAFNQWEADPAPALISHRLKRKPEAARGLRPDALLSALRGLAWTMRQVDGAGLIERGVAERQVADERVIACALDIGVMTGTSQRLRFENEAMRRYLALDGLRREGGVTVLPAPRFNDDQTRVASKWEAMARTLVDALTGDKRAAAARQISVVDPFLALDCARRHPEILDDSQGALIRALARYCAEHPEARAAFPGAIAGLPRLDQTAETMVGDVSALGNEAQSWLWREVRALPLELPAAFTRAVSEIALDAPAPIAEKFADGSLSLTVARLARLTAHRDAALRHKAIWLLGELKLLPTAILLLDDLESGAGDDETELLRALMAFAYSEILARILRWGLEKPAHLPLVIAALREEKRAATSALLELAAAERLALRPNFAEIAANTDEADIAIGLARIAADWLELPAALEAAVAARPHATELRRHLEAAIQRLPVRQDFARLLPVIASALEDPPAPIVGAGSKLSALLFGEPLFADFETPEDINAESQTPADQLAQSTNGAEAEAKPSFSDTEKIAHTLSALRSKEPRVALKAERFLFRFARSLRQSRDPQVSELLIVALQDADWRLRKAAAIALTLMDERAAVPHFKRLLADPNHSTQAAAVHCLLIMGVEGAAGLMLPLLDSPRSELRETVAKALGVLKAREAIAALSQTLRHDASGRTRMAALRSIHRIDPDAAQPCLELALGDSDPYVRLIAMERLAPALDESCLPFLRSCLGDSLTIGRDNETKSPRQYAMSALQRIDSAASRAILAADASQREGAGA